MSQTPCRKFIARNSMKKRPKLQKNSLKFNQILKGKSMHVLYEHDSIVRLLTKDIKGSLKAWGPGGDCSVNSKETGTIPASRILKSLWRLTCRSSPVLLNDKALQHSRVFAIHGCPQRPYKFGFTSELYKDWNDTCKPNFEAFVEADMQVIPSPP